MRMSGVGPVLRGVVVLASAGAVLGLICAIQGGGLVATGSTLVCALTLGGASRMIRHKQASN